MSFWQGSLGTIGFLATLWAAWTEYRLRAAQSELRRVQNEKQDILIRQNVFNMPSSVLDSELSHELTGPDPTDGSAPTKPSA